MKSLIALVKYAAIGFVVLLGLVGAAAMYGLATPTSDIDAKREAAAKRAAAEKIADERNEDAREAGRKTADAFLAVEKQRNDRKKMYSAGFDLGKNRSQEKKPMPDLSSINRLAAEIVASYGLKSELDEFETQFRAGYAKGFIAGK